MSSSPRASVVVVVRHGERLDYTLRAVGQNWVEKEIMMLSGDGGGGGRPWDPPITETGVQQAEALGIAMEKTILKSLSLPPIAAVYSSPFVRCRQTSCAIVSGIEKCRKEQQETNVANTALKVKVELGLSESINENWYRSWALPGTDGTWGYRKRDLPNPDLDSLNPAAKEPVQSILDWKQQRLDRNDGDDDQLLQRYMDQDHTSQTRLDTPYSYSSSNFESFHVQRDRMAAAMNQLSDQHDGETIVLVSHGGPVTHLYEKLTGNDWNVHGESKYCCFSIYQKETTPARNNGSSNGSGNDDDIKDPTWTPLVVNHVLGEDTSRGGTGSADRSASFQWS